MIRTLSFPPPLSTLAAALWLALASTRVAAATALEEVQFSAQPGNEIAVELVFSGPAPTPTDFATDNPPRIAIDFPDTASTLARKDIPIQLGAAQSLMALQAGTRTRVVVNLNAAVPYNLRTQGNRAILTLNPAPPAEMAAAPEPTAPVAPPEPSAAPPVALPVVPVAPPPNEAERQGAIRTARFGAAATATARAPLQDIDFRRSIDGSGRVLIALPSARTPVVVTEQGREVVVEIANTQLPQRLLRRLEVTDFGTPVTAIEARPEGQDVRLRIQTANEYEYFAYQTEKIYTVEFRPLTPAEKEQKQAEKVVYDGDRLTLNFQDIEVRAVLQLLADFTGLNLVASDTVKGNITLRLKSVPWDQGLDIVLRSKGLSMRQTGNVILVAPTQEIAAQERLELESKQQIRELAPLRSEFIQVNYAKAAELAALLKTGENKLLSERGQVTVDARTNTLLVQDTADRLEDVRRLILRLDIPVRQVMIESRVVVADNNFARDLGVRFGLTGSMGATGGNELLVAGGRPGHLSGTQSVDKGPFMGVYDTRFYQDPATVPKAPNNQYPRSPYNSAIAIADGNNPASATAEALLVNLPAVSPSGAINFLLGKVGSHLLQLELSAMQKEGRGEVVSAPRVVTSDQHQASIKLGQEIPYETISQQGTKIEWKEAVLQLDVTPHITPDDRIIMDLVVNKDAADWGNQVRGQPAINKRSVETSVLVENGETVVLGGVYEGTKFYNKEQVPMLGDLPVFGHLFKKNAKQETNTELLIFVTPKILRGDMAGR